MNIFHLDNDPKIAAQMMCDKHVVKMIVEYAQLMSTAHRVLDGEEYYDKTKNGRKIKRWKLKGAAEEKLLYKASHVNHPSNIWVRKSNDNYRWLYKHFIALGDEYKHRYGREHASITKLKDALYFHPDNIEDKGLTPLAQAMPDEYKDDDPIVAYRNYVIHEKHYAQWNKNREQPTWWRL